MLNEPVIQHTIRLCRQHRGQLPDASTAARAHGLTLVTRNVVDFQVIAGLVVINPYDAAQFTGFSKFSRALSLN